MWTSQHPAKNKKLHTLLVLLHGKGFFAATKLQQDVSWDIGGETIHRAGCGED